MLLAVDTSTQMMGLAVFDGAQVLGEFIWQSQNHHTVELAPAVVDILARCGIKTGDLSGLAVALGPGSFTSLRIGMALIKGMSLGLRLPVVGVPTLDILACATPVPPPGGETRLGAILQAGRGRLALRWYEAENGKWQPKSEIEVTTIEELAQKVDQPAIISGELTEAARSYLTRKRQYIRPASPAWSLRRPSFLAELAWERWRAGQTDPVPALAPIYLHIGEAIPS